ncbi:uncharacterized protein CC84DRAFT_1161267, partial [Paraphaeosphaeria sporulosa]
MSKIPDNPGESQTHEQIAQSEPTSKSKLEDKSPESTKEAHSKESKSPPKESYEDYIKTLPPPFWESKRPPPITEASNAPPRHQQDRSAEEIAASINAVCPPMTAADRAEDARKKSRSLRERWKDWREDRERDRSEVDIRPLDRGSSARLNVWGSPLTDKGRFKR